MNKEIIKAVFPELVKDIDEGRCPICHKIPCEFKDELSKKEYKISGLCQECQDAMFCN